MEQKNKKKISTQTIIKLLLAVVLLGLSAFLLKGVDFLDLVASGGSDGICCDACYRKTVLAF